MPNPFVMLMLGLVGLGLFAVFMFPHGGLIARWQRITGLARHIQNEDALKHIYASELAGHPATTQSVAGSLQINVNHAAALLAGLTEAELVTTADETLHLTRGGRDTARHILRAHRLWERRLADETGLPENEWHAQAEYYEHTLRPDDADALAAHLGNPTYDPHGDPIPPPEGEMRVNGGKPLSELTPDRPARITHLEDEPEIVFAQLVAEGLYPGMIVTVLERTPQRVRFMGDGEEHVLAPIVAANITALPLPRDVPVQVPRGESLAMLKPGNAARVIGISPRCRGPERRRMMDLGILPGTQVQAEFTSPSGDPTAFRIRGALIALRREQASLIEVSKLQEAE